MRNKNGGIVGGYTSQNWIAANPGKFVSDEKAFIFVLAKSKLQVYKPIDKSGANAIYCSQD